MHLKADGNCGIRSKKQLPAVALPNTSGSVKGCTAEHVHPLVVPVPRDPRESSRQQQLQLLLSPENQH